MRRWSSARPPGGLEVERASLLAVFAHPDDESLACGGLLALCAERGIRVSLLCLTRGEHGPGATTDLSDTRTRELHAAADVLGVAEVRLLDHEDGMLPWLDAEHVQADVLAAIRDSGADIVVTFDEDGLYWHPDHIAVHERVTASVGSLGDAPPELWYVSLPAGVMRAVVEAGGPGNSAGTIFGVDADAFGADAPEPTLVVSAGEASSRKLAALRCHRSQVGGGALDRIDDRDAIRLLGTEHYRRAPVGAAGESLLERLGAPVAATKS
jgi:N-acetyl-1-D-myo-inositol-2-amino-2-deoxy-alpha-D-glucopyranoside deacetylase